MPKTRTELAAIWPPTAEASREDVRQLIDTAAGAAPVRAGRGHSSDNVTPKRLILELIETQTTRDHVTDDGVFIRPPPGHGWRVLDAHRERFTRWQRRRPVVRVWKRRRK